MEFKVRIFLNERYIEPSDLPGITISNPTVDRIINAIIERAGSLPCTTDEVLPEDFS